MHKNKTQYGLLTADTSTPTHATICALIDTLDDQHITPACPQSLGLYTSIDITLLYLRENLPQRLLARMFDTSQPTISRAISTICDALEQTLADPPEPTDLDPRLYGVVDGTPVPCYFWANSPELYNGKHKTTGHNLQVIWGQAVTRRIRNSLVKNGWRTGRSGLTGVLARSGMWWNEPSRT